MKATAKKMIPSSEELELGRARLGVFEGEVYHQCLFKYYEVIATIDGEDEVLYGSYDRSDCLYEKEAESFWWKEQGYRQIRMQRRLVSEAPDPEVYPNL